MLGRNIIGFLFAFAGTLQVAAQYSSSCIEECVTGAFSDYGCSSLDLECICSNASFGDLVYNCISANCPAEIGNAISDYNSACTGYTTIVYSSTYSSESSGSYSYTSATDYNTTVVYSSSSYPSSSYPTPSYSTPSYSGYSSSSSSRPSAPSGYPTVPPTPSVYGVSSSSSTTTTPTPVNNGYGGAAGRNAVLPAAFVTLMAVMVAMAVV